MSQQTRPTITNGKIGVGNFGIGIIPDGTSDTLRVLIKPDGFHFEAYDFDDLILPSLKLQSPIGSEYIISFDDNGSLLINGIRYVPKQLKLSSPNGSVFRVVVDDDGKLTTEKEVSNA